jgi:membrane protease YdiL (CAAX protease family)
VPEKSPFPPVKHTFFILIATILFFSLLGEIWKGLPVKWEMAILEISAIIPVLIYIRIRRYSFRQIFRWHPVSKSVLIVSACIGVGVTIVTEEINRLVQLVIPMPDALVETLEKVLIIQSISDLFIVIIGIVIVTGFVEEMLFRGFLQGAMEQVTDVTRAVLVTSLVFTLIHLNPWWAVEILVLGVLLGVMTWRTNSIFPAVMVHCVNNGLAILMVNTDPSLLKWYYYKDHVSPVWIVLSIVLIIWAFRLFYHFTEKDSDKKIAS